MTEEEYFGYKVTDDGRPVLSSSFLKNGMPIWSGNAERLEAIYNESIIKESTPQMRFGTLVHKYAEDRSRFIMMPEFDMSPKIREIADKTFDLVESNRTDVWDNVSHHMVEFNIVCEEIGWGQSWKDETRLNKFREAADDYWDLRKSSIGKIVVTGDEVEKLRNVIAGIENAGLTFPVLRDRNEHVRREKAVLFELAGKYPAKALMDIVEIDHNKKQIIITDLKTTSGKIENFIQGYTYRENESGDIFKMYTAGDFIKYAYFFQAFFYTNAMYKSIQGTDIEKYEVLFQFAVVETKAPFLAKMIEMPMKWNSIASKEFIEVMKAVDKWYTKLKYLEF